MKTFFFIAFCLIAVNVAGQSTKVIKKLSDKNISNDLKVKIQSIKTVGELENFKFKKTDLYLDKDSAWISIKKESSFYFEDGKIKGEIKLIKSSVDYQPTTEIYNAELCYIFCCTKKGTNLESCTKDYKKFRDLMRTGNYDRERTTSCN